MIRGDRAYLPNIAASPEGPLRFNVDTEAFVTSFSGANGSGQADAGSINLHLGARTPEAGKTKLFFSNPWAIGFTNQKGAGAAYVVSAGSDLLVKMNVDAGGALSNTVNATTTRYIDLHDPANPAASGDAAGKNPRGIAINSDGTRAYVMNFVSRNVSVVDLTSDTVIGSIRTSALPAPGSTEEVVQVGAEMFFGSRGSFNRPGRDHRLDRGAALERGLAVVLQLPLRGHDRQRRLGVRRRAAQVGAAEPDLRPGQPEHPEDPQLLGDLRRGRGLRGSTSATSPDRAGSRPPRRAASRRRRRAPSTRITGC